MSPFSLPVSRLAPQPRTPLRQAPVRHIVPALVALAVSLTLGGCSEAPTSTIESSNETSIATAALAKGGAPKFWEQGSSVYWNRMGRELLATTPLAGNPAVQARVFTYLAIAQYNAVVAAENGAVKGDHPSGAAAAAAASVGVLKSLLPALSASIDTRLADQLASDPWPGEKNRDVAMGLAIGTQIAAAVVAYAATDNVGLTQAPPVPVGPG
ncbi:MAG TPA: hypothetical protein VE869_03060, partial [Gemmatimonas sp.]|nr:hypothetical protein [Gemmatimonas sp.]